MAKGENPMESGALISMQNNARLGGTTDQMMAGETNKAMETVGAGANRQLQNNRLNTANPFASQTFNPDGSVSQQFTGGLGTAASGLQNQAAGLGQAMDWSQFGKMGTGDDARAQAINSAFSQAQSRLDPMWNKREEMSRTRLLNQGLAEDSEAFKSAMGEMGRDRNDAYSSALNMAIGQGTQAGDSVFRNNMAGRQQSIGEALQQRAQPLSELGQLQGFLGNQPQYNADNSTLASAMARGGMLNQNAQGVADRQQQRFDNQFSMLTGQNQQAAGTAQGVMSGAASAAAFLPLLFSDARTKRHIYKSSEEALPGVPYCAFYYREGFGPPGLQVGVLAQDLEKVRPDLVATHPSGFKMVNYEGLREAAK